MNIVGQRLVLELRTINKRSEELIGDRLNRLFDRHSGAFPSQIIFATRSLEEYESVAIELDDLGARDTARIVTE